MEYIPQISPTIWELFILVTVYIIFVIGVSNTYKKSVKSDLEIFKKQKKKEEEKKKKKKCKWPC